MKHILKPTTCLSLLLFSFIALAQETMPCLPMTKSRAEMLVPRTMTKPVQSLIPDSEKISIDTIDTSNPRVKIVLFADNTWHYCKDAESSLADNVFTDNWSNSGANPYRLDYSALPDKTVIWLLDSTDRYHFPATDTKPVQVSSKYGRRHGRYHRGIDVRQPAGSPLYATFSGKVRIASYYRGYGNLVVIRHANGLETFYGHMSKINVKPDQWVNAGDVIGLAGSTGRSTGSHLHYEVRYQGFAIDPEWMINFSSQELHHGMLVIKKKMLFPDSKFVPENDEEEEDIAAADEKDREEAARLEAEMKAAKYYTIRSGDTLGAIAKRNGTTVSALCRLNGITAKTTLRIGRKIRVK